MAYASKRRLNWKTCYRMHDNALFRMEKVKKNSGEGHTSPLPRGGGTAPDPSPVPRPYLPRRLRRLDSRAFGTRPPLLCSLPARRKAPLVSGKRCDTAKDTRPLIATDIGLMSFRLVPHSMTLNDIWRTCLPICFYSHFQYLGQEFSEIIYDTQKLK